MGEGENKMDYVETVADHIVDHVPGMGFERVHVLHESTYKDNSTMIICPTRGSIHHRVATAIYSMIGPMNQPKGILFVAGAEVADAYNKAIQMILDNPVWSKWQYVFTIEDDNLPPPDAHIKLIEAIESGPYDGVSGLYFTKGDYQMPQAYGDNAEYRRTGRLDFRPLDVRKHLKAGEVIPVNGIAMGCSLYRMDLFREVRKPWFQTIAEWIPERGTRVFTQDLAFCEKAMAIGKHFAVHCGVRVGHMDVRTGLVYLLTPFVLSLFSMSFC